MELNAYAKINLTLNVVKKREDGYHELEMIMVPLTLHDTVTIEKSDQDSFTCNHEDLVMDESNTVCKAVELMRETYQLKDHFKIHIHKRIPMQAGLAGGSADAAAVLRGLNKLCELQIDIAALSMLGKQIGADVPYCVYQTPAVVKGIGEHVTPFPIAMAFSILLVKPQAGVPTGKAFSMIDFTTCEHPDYHIVEQALKNQEYEAFCAGLGNTLEQTAFQIVPAIKELKAELTAFGFDAVLMSGSGSTVFAITRDQGLLERAYQKLAKEPYFVYKTSIK